MHGNVSGPLKMTLTLVPEVGADRQDGAAKPASQRLLVDVAVSRRQKTGALVASELTLSGIYAHTTVYALPASRSCRGAPAQ